MRLGWDSGQVVRDVCSLASGAGGSTLALWEGGPSMGRSFRLLLAGTALAFVIATAVLATLLAAPSRASAQANPERSTIFDARITLQRDWSTLVTEQITYDFGTDHRHAVYRVTCALFRYYERYD